METTLFLSKLFGLSMLIIGIPLIVKWRDFRDMVVELLSNKGIFYLLAIIELIAGIALILSHNVWGTLLESLVSVIGWMMAIEATLYMFMPHEKIESFIEYFNKKSFYKIGSVIYIILGFYFVYNGFFF